MRCFLLTINTVMFSIEQEWITALKVIYVMLMHPASTYKLLMLVTVIKGSKATDILVAV